MDNIIEEPIKLDKETLWKILSKQAENLKAQTNQLLVMQESSQTLLQENQSKLEILTNLMMNLTQEEHLEVNVKDYLTPEEYQDYLLTYSPNMLCEFDIPLRKWFDWFYQELPFLKSKHLVFFDINKDIKLSLADLDLSWIIKVDHVLKRIYVNRDNDHFNSVINIDLNGISLYEILNVTSSNLKDSFIAEQHDAYGDI